MHTLIAVTFPEMGRGFLAVIVFGAALLAGLAAVTMLYSAVRLWRAHAARHSMVRKQRALNAVGTAMRARVRAR